jgi:predicted RNase H-like HicB family nuclease
MGGCAYLIWHKSDYPNTDIAGIVSYTRVIEDSMKYKIALQKTEEGYSVSVPGLPGCWSQGATEEEAIANIRDAIRHYLGAREELLRDAIVREIEVSV